MNDILKLFISLSVSGSILALILFAIKPLVKNRLSKRWQYYIWLVVILRFLIPLSLDVSLVGKVFTYVETNVAEYSGQTWPDMSDEQLPIPTDDDNLPNDNDSITQTAAPNYWNDLKNNIWLLRLGVALLLLVRKVTSYHSFVRYVRAGAHRIEDKELLELYHTVSSESGKKKPLPIYVNQLVASPMLVGILKPIIIIPTLDFNEDKLRYVIRHELTHYKHLDIFYKWITQIVVCLHWFNPLVYVISREVNRTCELSCDEAIINILDQDERLQYGDTLLTTLKTDGTYNDTIASITLSENTKLLMERLEAIMIFKKKPILTFFASVLLTCLLLCGFAFTGAYAAPQYSTDFSMAELIKDDILPSESWVGMNTSDLYLINMQEWSSSQIRSIEATYNTDRVSILPSLSDKIVLKEYFSENNAIYGASTELDGSNVRIVYGDRPTNTGYVSRIEIYIPTNISVKVSTTSGRINISDYEGILDANTSSGKIEVSNSIIGGNISSVSGAIDLTISNLAGDLNASSNSGRVTANIPQSIDFIISASSNTGKVHNNFSNSLTADNKLLTGTWGNNPNYTITLRSTSSNVIVNAQ